MATKKSLLKTLLTPFTAIWGFVSGIPDAVDFVFGRGLDDIIPNG